MRCKSNTRFASVILAIGILCVLVSCLAAEASSEYERSLSSRDPAQREWLRQRAAEIQERYRLHVPVPDAVGPISPVNPLPPPVGQQAKVAETQLSAPRVVPYQNVLNGALVCLVALLIAQKLGASRKPSADPAAGRAARSHLELAEDLAFAQFLASFKAGPARPGGSIAAQGPNPPDLADSQSVESERDPVKRFFAWAPTCLRGLRKVLQEISQGPDSATRQKLLGDLCGEFRTLKGIAGLPELLPVWQLASASEWLLKQLADRPEKATSSTLRTVAAGVDLLEELCRPGLKANLCSEPPLRFLSVDDDAISRHAVSFSLKKAFSQPDVAANGEAALALTSKIAYDVIFLDIQMPGMNGFELCSKIGESELNHSTPVVFVTCQSDFEARVQSTLCGGTDLLGKPFLTFEIALKALTLATRRRLQPAEGKEPQTTTEPASNTFQSPTAQNPRSQDGEVAAAVS